MSSAHERVNGAAPATSLDNHRAAMALLGSHSIDGRWVSLDWDLRTGDWGAVDITRLDTEQYSVGDSWLACCSPVCLLLPLQSR